MKIELPTVIDAIHPAVARVNYNSRFMMLILLGLVTSCANPSPGRLPANAVSCTDPRPQMCTMDYTPVCAARSSGDEIENATYANGCGACSDAAVIYHLAGECNL